VDADAGVGMVEGDIVEAAVATLGVDEAVIVVPIVVPIGVVREVVGFADVFIVDIGFLVGFVVVDCDAAVDAGVVFVTVVEDPIKQTLL